MAAGRFWSAVLCAWLPLLLLWPTWSWAHGFAGQRFFPTTLAIDDPFVSDELSPAHNRDPPCQARGSSDAS